MRRLQMRFISNIVYEFLTCTHSFKRISLYHSTHFFDIWNPILRVSFWHSSHISSR